MATGWIGFPITQKMGFELGNGRGGGRNVDGENFVSLGVATKWLDSHFDFCSLRAMFNSGFVLFLFCFPEKGKDILMIFPATSPILFQA